MMLRTRLLFHTAHKRNDEPAMMSQHQVGPSHKNSQFVVVVVVVVVVAGATACSRRCLTPKRISFAWRRFNISGARGADHGLQLTKAIFLAKRKRCHLKTKSNLSTSSS